MRGAIAALVWSVMGVFFGGCASMSSEGVASAVIRARGIEIVDDREVVRMSLAVNEDDLAQVRVLDGQGRVQSVLGQALDGTVVWMAMDSLGVPRLALGLEPKDRGGMIQLADANGGVRAYIGGDGRGGVTVMVLDPSGKKIIMDESGLRSVKTGD